MSIDVAQNIWSELKRYIGPPDRGDAADSLVNILIDNDHDAEQIRAAFKGDSDVKQALQSYLDDNDEDSEEDSDDHEEDEY